MYVTTMEITDEKSSLAYLANMAESTSLTATRTSFSSSNRSSTVAGSTNVTNDDDSFLDSDIMSFSLRKAVCLVASL